MIYISEKEIKDIINTYGETNQKNKAVEEMLELSVAVARDVSGRKDRENIVEEIADVYIMLRQLEKIYHVSPVELQRQIEFKMDRQMKRVKRKKIASRKNLPYDALGDYRKFVETGDEQYRREFVEKYDD